MPNVGMPGKHAAVDPCFNKTAYTFQNCLKKWVRKTKFIEDQYDKHSAHIFSSLFLNKLKQQCSSASELDFECQQLSMNLIVLVSDLKCCWKTSGK